jgi:hypothetical protein
VSGVSGISSLGQSQGSSRSSRTQRTRHITTTTGDGTNSDEEDTDNEDNYQVDFSENFWQSREELQEMVQNDLVDEEVLGVEGDVDSCPDHAGQFDFARMLRDCSDFDFTELTEEEANEMPVPPEIYSGESGLKRGVACTFDTPLGAFQRSGFTKLLVERWTDNSNRYGLFWAITM